MKKSSLAINRCPRCRGGGKIWDFSDHEEPVFYWCELCQGEVCTVNN